MSINVKQRAAMKYIIFMLLFQCENDKIVPLDGTCSRDLLVVVDAMMLVYAGGGFYFYVSYFSFRFNRLSSLKIAFINNNNQNKNRTEWGPILQQQNVYNFKQTMVTQKTGGVVGT